MRIPLFLTTILCLSSVSRTMADLARSNEAFGKTLFKVIGEKEGNLICSPISAHIVLSMAATGAGGQTKTNMFNHLHIDNADSTALGYSKFLSDVDAVRTNVTLDLANKIYIMKNFPLKPDFSKTMIEMYRSETEELDFSQKEQSAGAINAWVENKTNKKIKDLIKPDSLSQDTRLVLVNAIYFKGNWAKQFDKANTKEEPFYLSDGSEVKCNMMHMTSKFHYKDSEDLQAKILKMDYADNRVSMVFFLPNERNGLKQMEEKLQHFDFQKELESLHNYEVVTSIPKFKIESTIELTDVLKKMGMTDMFSNNANFSGISTSPEELYVSEVIQKAFVEVNEEGAEAAAATGLVVNSRSDPRLLERFYKHFKADHPFLLAILLEKDEQKHTVFLGKITNMLQ